MITARSHPLLNWDHLTAQDQARLLSRPGAHLAGAGDDVEIDDAADSLAAQVANILAQVKRDGDGALRKLSWVIDKVKQNSSWVQLPTKTEAVDRLQHQNPQLWQALLMAEQQIREFHQLQLRADISQTSLGGQLICERVIRPLHTVGFYIPNGQTPLISTLLMLAIPAQLAGVTYKVLCSPPMPSGGVHPLIRDLASWLAIDEVHALGGAQAIAAMAYGTESVSKVDKIFGPGNAWTTAAKQQVATCSACHGVAIDMPAGPSEVMVVADLSAKAAYIAADLLAQAEHGVDSQVISVFVGDDTHALSGLYDNVLSEIAAQLPQLGRTEVIQSALQHSRFIQVAHAQIACELINSYAPEHLILQVATPRAWLAKINHAGSIFMGHHTPESFGDYASGTNHVLPTAGYARSMSGIGVESFQKTMTIQEFTPMSHPHDHAHQHQACHFLEAVKTLAQTESLDAHRWAVVVRELDDNDDKTNKNDNKV